MRRQRSLKRAVGTRGRKKKFFLFCEGKNTEPLYFKAYELAVNSAVVELICEPAKGVPKTLLRHAEEKIGELNKRSYIKENGNEDQVWVVFDEDDHDDIPMVQERCTALGIHVAYSNPCFEVWLILHFESYDKDEHRDLTQKYCESTCSGYAKDGGKTPDFSSLIPRYQDAESRAEKLLKRREEDGGAAPLTTVHLLTKEIRKK
ncbi:RloB family protein [Celeribacter sp.]|uniref:RloB family protein n=1 Tax=Celeribacter sp. TaxID=1890673 RepID=UPI003A8D71FC